MKVAAICAAGYVAVAVPLALVVGKILSGGSGE